MNIHQKTTFFKCLREKIIPSRLDAVGDWGTVGVQLERYLGDKSASGHSRQVRAWQSLRFWFFWPGGENWNIWNIWNPEPWRRFFEAKRSWFSLGNGTKKEWVNAGDGNIPPIDGNHAEYKAGTWKPTLDVFNICMFCWISVHKPARDQALATHPNQNEWWKSNGPFI